MSTPSDNTIHDVSQVVFHISPSNPSVPLREYRNIIDIRRMRERDTILEDKGVSSPSGSNLNQNIDV